jgi:hypothetical protein
MRPELDGHGATELGNPFNGALRELSSEIAGNDNAQYARELRSRRETLDAAQRRPAPSGTRARPPKHPAHTGSRRRPPGTSMRRGSIDESYRAAGQRAGGAATHPGRGPSAGRRPAHQAAAPIKAARSKSRLE